MHCQHRSDISWTHFWLLALRLAWRKLWRGCAAVDAQRGAVTRTTSFLAHNNIHFRHDGRIGSRMRRLHPRVAGLRRQSIRIHVLIQGVRATTLSVNDHVNKLATGPHAAQALQAEMCAVLHFLAWNPAPFIHERVQVLLRSKCQQYFFTTKFMEVVSRVLLVHTDNHIFRKAAVEGQRFLVANMRFLTKDTGKVFQRGVDIGTRAPVST